MTSKEIINERYTLNIHWFSTFWNVKVITYVQLMFSTCIHSFDKFMKRFSIDTTLLFYSKFFKRDYENRCW